MERQVVKKIADCIISPMGITSAGNFASVKEGKSALKLYEGLWDIPEPFMASLVPEDLIDDIAGEEPVLREEPHLTRFERLSILSAAKAIEQAGVDITSGNVIFVISTTKGNVELLGKSMCGIPEERVLLGRAARAISGYFKNPNNPVVVSNACTSGACAQLVAKRLLLSGRYDYAVVVGCDVQSKFIVSGFQAFKALSTEDCRPFDKDRAGLNLGEAAAAIVFKRVSVADVKTADWILCDGAIRNDANHISGPSRTGEGSYRCLRYIMRNGNTDELAFINAHGTATSYNDEMESIAIERSGLTAVPVNGYKGYYGHTMGAAGVIETILSQMSIDNGLILPTRGFSTSGVSGNITINDRLLPTDKTSFIKLLSGFGGCNVALLYKKGGAVC